MIALVEVLICFHSLLSNSFFTPQHNLYFISIISSLLVKTSSLYAVLISYSIVEVSLDLLCPFSTTG